MRTLEALTLDYSYITEDASMSGYDLAFVFSPSNGFEYAKFEVDFCRNGILLPATR